MKENKSSTIAAEAARYLYVMAVVDGRIKVCSDEVGVVGKPTNQKYCHHTHHHLNHLKDGTVKENT